MLKRCMWCGGITEAEGREWVRARQAEQVLGVQGAAEGEPCGRELGR